MVLVFGQCGTHGGDRVREAGLVERDRVEVPLDDHRDALLPDGGAGGVQGVEGRALVEECCSLRVDVLPALVGAHRPASESDDPAAAVLYWDDQPVPEPVEDASVIPADQARGDGLVVRVALLPEVADKSVPAVRGITQPKLFHRFRVDPPVGDVTGDFFAALGAPEGLAEVEMRGVVRGEEALLALLLGGVAPARQLHSGTLGEDPQGFDGLDSVQLLEPGEDVPVFATTKTVIGPPIGVDGERGRLLRVKRTET